MSTTLSKFLVNRDIYGHKIGVHYKGSDTYKTKMGAFCTMATYLLIIFNFVALCIAYYD